MRIKTNEHQQQPKAETHLSVSISISCCIHEVITKFSKKKNQANLPDFVDLFVS